MGEAPGFVWSDVKDEENRRKHGLPLRFGALLFLDHTRLERSAKTVHGELRFMAIGRIGDRVLTCVFALRNGDRRLVSVRPASRRERRAYATQTDDR